MFKVFLSSTGRDLREYREVVYHATHRMDGFHCVRMADFGARDAAPLDYCRELVATCDVFLGITGLCYGSCPPHDTTSFTEHEYNTAAEHERPRLMFVAPDDFPLPGNLVEPDKLRRRQQRFRKRIKTEQIVAPFDSPDALAAGVVAALANWRSQQQARILAQREQPTGPGRLYGDIPTFPGGYVERRGELARLRRAVLENAGAVAVTGKGVGVGVQGMGGIGKTLLAAALVRDEEVRRAFPGDLCWVTLGQHANPVAAQTRLVTLLGDEAPRFTEVVDGRTRLNELLADRRALVVVDDVWSVPDAAAFALRDTASRLLVTTRSLEVVRGIDAAEHRVDELEPEEARDVLAKFAGLASADALPSEAEEIIRETGRLPLALAMIGALAGQLSGSWGDLLDALRRADLEAIAATLPGYPYPNLLRALQVSIDALDEDERRRYFDLAVLPEDVAVPLDVLGVLWADENLSGLRLRRLAGGFVARSLARWDEDRRLTLHDLQRAYLRAKVDDLPERHGRLVAAYRARCRDGWWTGPDDGYFFQHLPWHLAMAREREPLRDLLFDYRWLQSKLIATSVAELITDYALLRDDPQATWLAGALRLSAHALDPRELAGQLLGRLRPDDGPEIARLLATAHEHVARPSLLPRWPTLTRPGTPLVRIYTGHDGPVFGAVVLADGRRALSWSADKTLRLWDLGRESGPELLRRFEGPDEAVGGAVVLPDGAHALSWSRDGTLRLWELERDAEPRVFAGDGGSVIGAVVLAGGRCTLSWSSDSTMRLWSLKSGASRVVKGHGEGVSGAVVLADGRQALSWSGHRTLTLWDLRHCVERRRFEGHDGAVVGAVVLAGGRCALSWSEDETLRLWSLKSGASRVLKGHKEEINGAVVLADGRRALSWSVDGTLPLWDLETEGDGELWVFEGHSGAVDGAVVLAGGREALSWSTDGTLRLWDLKSGAGRVLEEHGSYGPSYGFNEVVLAGGRHALAWWDRTLLLWDLVLLRQVGAD